MESLETKKKAGNIEEELRELEKFIQQERENINFTTTFGEIYTILCCD